MPILTHLTDPSGGTYELHDLRVDKLNKYIYHKCSGAADTPKGIKWTPSGGSQITGTLTAAAGDYDPDSPGYKAGGTESCIFLVYSPNDKSDDIYDEYITVKNSSGGTITYSWERMGSTDIKIDGLSGSYTPAGSVSQPTFSGTAATIKVPTISGGTVSQPTFSGTAVTLTSKGTPSGTVSKPTFSGTAATIKVGGTPSGTVSQPTFSGTAATIKATGTPQLNASTVNVPKETYSVSGTTLTISTTNVALVTSVSGAATTFQAVHTPGGTVSQPTFSGAAATYQGAYTPAGGVSQPTFSGAEMSSTIAYTPAGTVSKPTFSPTASTSSVAYTPAGTVSKPTFSGTAATITVH